MKSLVNGTESEKRRLKSGSWKNKHKNNNVYRMP